MVKKVYLEINKNYGRLTLIKALPYSNDNGYSLSLCRCDCGNIIEAATCRVLSGLTRSCGCLRSDTSRSFNFAKWKQIRNGIRYGQLTVLVIAGKTEHNELIYRCQCDCGNETVVLGKRLVHKQVVSCGCAIKEEVHYKLRKKKSILPGTRFGSLRVLAPEGRNNTGAIKYKCACQCGNTASVLGPMLRDRTIRSCGCVFIEPKT